MRTYSIAFETNTLRIRYLATHQNQNWNPKPKTQEHNRRFFGAVKQGSWIELQNFQLTQENPRLKERENWQSWLCVYEFVNEFWKAAAGRRPTGHEDRRRKGRTIWKPPPYKSSLETDERNLNFSSSTERILDLSSSYGRTLFFPKDTLCFGEYG